ncbi:MAG: hypothetical protein ACK4UP_08855 [Spirosomataceae bacterium]
MFSSKFMYLGLFSTLLVVSCKSGEDVEPEENEFISTVQLELTEGMNTQKFSWKDLDGEGGNAPTVEKVTLATGKSYTMRISFLNETVMPVEDITEEIEEEADEHLVVFTVSPAGLVSVNVTDRDAKNLPIGLESRVTTTTAGSGELRVVLRHQPPVNGVATKDGTATPGSTDVDVVFPIEVK